MAQFLRAVSSHTSSKQWRAGCLVSERRRHKALVSQIIDNERCIDAGDLCRTHRVDPVLRVGLDGINDSGLEVVSDEEIEERPQVVPDCLHLDMQSLWRDPFPESPSRAAG